MEDELEVIYKRRFASSEEQRERVWRVLTSRFFQRWVQPRDVVLDVGAG